MAVRFIIDSAADIVPAEAEALGLIHLPLKVIFGEEEYSDSVDLTHHEFYEKLIENDEIPTTSQINPGVFMSAYQKVVDEGDTAVVITLSGKLSGTYQSAMIALDGFEDKIFVVDSESVCVGERILIQLGLKLRDQGLSAAEIAAELDLQKKHVRVLALLDTLEYLKKGGRISAAVAFAGNLLSIKPVIAIENGEVSLVGKARGSKKGNNLLRELITNCGGINFDKPFALAYSGLSDRLLQKYIEDSSEIWSSHAETLPISTVGCTIGTHAGPGAVAVAFFEN
ncbi:MAG: DegV family protein [Lachnospiraceae bacterium]|nr:DegV family protein [Lachnospiraceae bacterium]MBQ5868925.1 DegV family protein [Lachnospiraceae bacterium]